MAAPVLEATNCVHARELIAAAKAEAPTTKGLSAQAFGIAPKMREADLYMRSHPGAQDWLYECHPELSFRRLAEGQVLRDKKSVGGQAERLRPLGCRLPSVLDAPAGFQTGSGGAELADALDALAALDTALHLRADDYEQLGGEADSVGLVMRMVC